MKGYEVILCVENDGLEVRPEQVAHLEAVLQEADICPTIDNDGIGPYEFWGAKCYDHGTDRLIVEADEYITVRVLVYGIEGPEELPAIARGLQDVFGELDTERTVRTGGMYGTAKAAFTKMGEAAEGGNAVFTYEVEWEAGEDLEADL